MRCIRMKKVFFIVVFIIISLLVYFNLRQKENIMQPEEITYITVTASGNIDKPATYKVPSTITEEELLDLVGVRPTSVYSDFEIYDGLVLNFGEVVDNPIVIETATFEELDSLPEIGESRANKIIEYLKTKGGFKDWDEFFSVVGISNSEDKLRIKEQAILR